MYKNTNLFLLLNIHISKLYLFTQFMLNSDYTYQIYMETFIDRTNHNFCYFLWNIRTGQIFHSFIDVKSGIFTVLKNEINTMHASYFKKKMFIQRRNAEKTYFTIYPSSKRSVASAILDIRYRYICRSIRASVTTNYNVKNSCPFTYLHPDNILIAHK